MPNSENAIFICYRREDSNSAARGIYDRLKVAFGEKAVFLDHFGFKGGDEWRKKTKPILENAKAVLVIVHKDWVEIGRKRLKDVDDPVRQELDLALRRPDVAIVPVTIDRTSFPGKADADSLAESGDAELADLLGKLFAKTANKVRFDRDFESDIQQIVRLLDDVPGIDLVRETASYDVGGLQAIRAWETNPKRPAPRPNDPTASDLWILQPKYRSIPLLARENDLAGLRAWLETPQPIAARLLIGRAGAGKTRLGLEFLWEVFRDRGDRWDVGVLKGESLRAYGDWNAWHWDRPTLLVIDYAQALSDAVGKMLVALACKDQDPNLPPLRLLLLEREANAREGWFKDLLDREDSVRGGAVRDLFDPPEPVTLQPLDTPEVRRELLRSTLARAAESYGREPLDVPDAGFHQNFDDALADPRWNEPLYLMMAALEAARTSGAGPAPEERLIDVLRLNRVDLAKEVAKHELARLDRFVPDGSKADARNRLLRHLAACATLCGGFSGEQALEAAEEESQALHLVWPSGAGDLADVLARAFPAADHGVAAVQPDIVGEALTLLALTDRLSAKQQADCIVRGARRNISSVAAAVFRSFQNYHADVRDAETLMVWVDGLIDAPSDGDADWLAAIDEVLPHQTVALRERAAHVVQRLYERRRTSLGEGDSVSDRADAARLANNLSLRLSALGRREEALERAEEAVAVYRDLERLRLEAFRPDLASSLNSLANRLSDLGRREEALERAEEAVDIRRDLAKLRPDAFHPDLALSLNNFAAMLSDLGRREEALEHAEEAVTIYRELAIFSPDIFRPALASSLSNSSTMSSAVGRREEALELGEEAVAVYRELATLRPDAFRPNLATSLNNLANRLAYLGRCEEALARAEEAVGIRRELAALGDDAFRPDLATSLNNLATLLKQLGRRDEALKSAEEAIAIYRELAALRPDVFRPDLATSLGALGQIHSAGLDHARAAACFFDGMMILQPSFQRVPGAFTLLMVNLIRDYSRSCEAGGIAIDADQVAPIVESFKSIERSSNGSDADPSAPA